MTARRPPLSMWTIYENPKDFPGKYVVRESVVMPEGLMHYARPVAIVDSLETARAAAQTASPYVLTLIPRNPDDDPVIVEVWL